jgi:hypothetical protein
MLRLTTAAIFVFVVGCLVSELSVTRPASPHSERSPASMPESGAPVAASKPEPEPSVEEEPAEEEEPDLSRHVWERLLRQYRPDPYMLDHLSRAAERDRRGRLDCPDVEIERYRGETIRYRRTVWVHPAFRERLKRFERIAARVGEEVYGRAPDRLFQRGTLVCKVIRHRKYRFSEHALGNAIDLIALGFPPLPRDERDEAEAPGRRFKITVEDDWDGTEGEARLHSIFWKRLVQELRSDMVFRGMIVPPAPGHHDHLHLDMGRWRYFRGDLTLPAGEPQANAHWAR